MTSPLHGLAVVLVLGAAAWAAGDPAGGGFLDAAPFARVCTWDPTRTNGVRATRVQEIAAEDLFLETDLAPRPQGGYVVPGTAVGRACVGLQWLEGRPIRSLALEFDPGAHPPALVEAVVQAWVGETQWQGQWVSLEGRLEASTNGGCFTLAAPGRLFQKVRWTFPAGAEPVVVRRLSALTTSTLAGSTITLRRDRPVAAGSGHLEAYNAFFIEEGRPVTERAWDLRQPLTLSVRHVAPSAAREAKGDRGTVRLRLPEGAFAVAIDDVLERGPVWVPHAGLFVTAAGSSVDPGEYRRELAGKRTILEEVRALPDQTRERAMAVTHGDPRLDAGRLMLSLAADNAKFVTEANGALQFIDDFSSDDRAGSPNYTVVPVLGSSRVVAQSQGWGLLGLDRAAHADPARALALRIHTRDYARGLGHHAPGEIVIDVGGAYERFEAEVGLQWQGGAAPGSVTFEVLVDGRKEFESGVMRENDSPQPVRVALAGARTLTLRLGDAGDGLGYDAGDWAEARLVGPDGVVDLADLCRSGPRPVRRLEGGWLPAPVITTSAGGVEYVQRTYVVPFGEQSLAGAPRWLNAWPLGVVELSLQNTNREPVDARMAFLLTPGPAQPGRVVASTHGRRATLAVADRLLAVCDAAELPGAALSAEGHRVAVSTALPPAGRGRLFLYLPAWNLAPDQQAELHGGPALFDRFRDYWESVLAPSMQVELPDRWLSEVLRANQVHILMAARNEQQGRLVVPWIASDRYVTAIDSEGNSVIRGMQDFGHFDFAERAFEYYFSRYQPEGFLTTGYTLMGNGWHLWTLGEYLRRSGSDAWFRSVVDRPAGLCQWVTAQLAKTRRARAGVAPVPEYGLMPPGVQADWNAYAYYFYANSYFQAGLEGMGRALGQVGHPEAARVLAAAGQLRVDLLRAFRESQALAPVVPLRNGTWVPYYPSSVYTPGPIADFYPGQDANRSWAYDVELGAHHLVALGVLAADAPETGWMLDHMEDVHFLSEGWGGYPAARSQAEWFDCGGFAKVQPYYARNAEIYALRDDVKPFVRSYLNTLASLIDGTALSIFEHFSNFCYNKTHETGYFLHQSRTMLLTERDDELWLAPFVTTHWLRQGRVIDVKNAPTFFGPVSYRIQSSVDTGRIEAVIDPPTRQAPKAIVLRLRHPAGRPMRSVTVDGRPHPAFDVGKEIIRLAPGREKIRVEARYGDPR